MLRYLPPLGSKCARKPWGYLPVNGSAHSNGPSLRSPSVPVLKVSFRPIRVGEGFTALGGDGLCSPRASARRGGDVKEPEGAQPSWGFVLLVAVSG